MIYYYIIRVTEAFSDEPTYEDKILRVHNIITMAEDDDEVTPLEMKYLYKIVENLMAMSKEAI